MLSLHAGFGCGKGPVGRPIRPGRAPGSVAHGRASIGAELGALTSCVGYPGFRPRHIA
jgi:hypothetical protein